MFSGSGRAAVFENKINWSNELALLVGSLWFAILCASFAGLVWPRVFVPILLAQVIYKALFLLLVAYPLWRTGAVPMGISTCFAFIVVTYPVAIWAMWRPV